MATDLAAVTTPSIGTSLSGLGTALGAFVMAHPVAFAALGGLALGAGAYHAVSAWRGGRKDKAEAKSGAEPAAAAA